MELPVYTSIPSLLMDFTVIYLNISLFHWTVGSSKADSLSGSPSIFISWHRAWHMMDQSSRSCYSLLSPTPSVLSLVSREYTLISIFSYLHLSRSMAYFTFINPGVIFSIFILIPLSAPIKLPLLPDTNFPMAFGPPLSQSSIYLIGCSFSAFSDDPSVSPCPPNVRVSQASFSSSAYTL